MPTLSFLKSRFLKNFLNLKISNPNLSKPGPFSTEAFPVPGLNQITPFPTECFPNLKASQPQASPNLKAFPTPKHIQPHSFLSRSLYHPNDFQTKAFPIHSFHKQRLLQTRSFPVHVLTNPDFSLSKLIPTKAFPNPYQKSYRLFIEGTVLLVLTSILPWDTWCRSSLSSRLINQSIVN